MSKTELERAILVDLFVHGDDKAENIANRCGFHRNSVSGRLKGLLEDGDLHHKGGGVYRLTDSGREAARGLIKAGDLPY